MLGKCKNKYKKSGSMPPNISICWDRMLINLLCWWTPPPHPPPAPYAHSIIRREIIVRGQSYFSRLLKYWPPIPLSTWRVCPPPATKAGGTHSPGGEGDGGVNILEDERNRIALLQWSLYGIISLRSVHVTVRRSPSHIRQPRGYTQLLI